jgi:hypothetical protein
VLLREGSKEAGATMARYDAFLLRIWRSEAGAEVTQWAIRLAHLPDGAGLRFGDLDALFEHLRTQLCQDEPPTLSPIVDEPRAPPQVESNEGEPRD